MGLDPDPESSPDDHGDYGEGRRAIEGMVKQALDDGDRSLVTDPSQPTRPTGIPDVLAPIGPRGPR